MAELGPLLFPLIFFFFHEFCIASGTIIKTKSGTFEGIEEHGYISFLGIPYALPPIGDLRWSPPLPYPDLTSPFLASSYGNNCTNIEDCLYLNVWIPEGPPITGSLPVMVFIHGDCDTGGSGNLDLNSIVTGSSKPVITVSFNYRLNVLGFLGGSAIQANTSDHSTGNFGLQDQRAALMWVQRNIAAFGGNISNIMLFGQSGGAASVAAHLTAPKSKGLFSRAGIEAGAFTSWNSVSVDEAQQTYDRLLVTTNCSSLACLRKIPFESITRAGSTEGFAPTVDGVEFAAPIDELVLAGNFTHVPILLGINRDEASLFTDGLDPMATPPQYMTWLNIFFGAFSSDVSKLYPSSAQGNRDGYSVNWWNGMNALTDSDFLCPHLRTAARFTNVGVPVYLYYFTHVVSPAVTVPRGAETRYVFHALNDLMADPDGAALSGIMLNYWVNFASAGDPNSNDVTLPLWPPYYVNGSSYIDIHNSSSITVHTELKTEQCTLWNELQSQMDYLLAMLKDTTTKRRAA